MHFQMYRIQMKYPICRWQHTHTLYLSNEMGKGNTPYDQAHKLPNTQLRPNNFFPNFHHHIDTAD